MELIGIGRLHLLLLRWLKVVCVFFLLSHQTRHPHWTWLTRWNCMLQRARWPHAGAPEPGFSVSSFSWTIKREKKAGTFIQRNTKGFVKTQRNIKLFFPNIASLFFIYLFNFFIFFIFWESRDHPRCSNWTLDFEPAFLSGFALSWAHDRFFILLSGFPFKNTWLPV